MTQSPILELDEVTKRFVKLSRTQFTPPIPLLSRLTGRIASTEDVTDDDDDDVDDEEDDEDFEFPRQAGPRLLALDRVSFTVSPGEQVGVLGRSGAGKTTLLRLVTGISVPTSGRITARGRLTPLFDLAQAVTRSDGHPQRNLEIIARTGGLSRKEARRRADEILAFAGVESFEPGAEVPKGLVRPMTFSAALHLSADLIVLDDLTDLSPAFRERCLERLAELRGGPRAVLLATGDQEVLHGSCTSAHWLNEGAIQASGTPADVVEAVHRAVAEDVIRHAEGRDSGLSSVRERLPVPVRSFNASAAVTGAAATPGPDGGLRLDVEVEVADRPVNVQVVVGLARAGADVVGFREPTFIALTAPGRYALTAEVPSGLVGAGSYEGHVTAVLDAESADQAIGRARAFRLEVGSDAPAAATDPVFEVLTAADGRTWLVHQVRWTVARED